jgi:cyclopropane-fatty-acyl-phospholipid synthase
MAIQAQIEATYNYMDELFRITLGEHGDFSGAMYNGDFTLTLEQAQQAKRDFILEQLHIGPGSRVLDVGCGWGPLLNAVRQRGGHGIGLTLSTRQAQACRRNGLDAQLLDWKNVTVQTFGRFDAVVSVGSFEHYCSKEEYLAGKQEAIYRQFFRLCSDLLPVGGRLYLQTMLWGKNAPACAQLSLQAPKDSPEYLVAMVSNFYPGSWLPASVEQITECSRSEFEILSLNNGRKDYIETIHQWNCFGEFKFRKLWPALKLVPKFLFDGEFRCRMRSLKQSCHRACFEREIMDHQRMVLEKKPDEGAFHARGNVG